MFFVLQTPKGWNQVHICTDPISVSFWQLHTKFYSSKKHESNEITDETKSHSTPTKTKTVLQPLYVLPCTYYEGMELEEICLLAKYQPSSGHYIELSIVQKLVLVK